MTLTHTYNPTSTQIHTHTHTHNLYSAKAPVHFSSFFLPQTKSIKYFQKTFSSQKRFSAQRPNSESSLERSKNK